MKLAISSFQLKWKPNIGHITFQMIKPELYMSFNAIRTTENDELGF